MLGLVFFGLLMVYSSSFIFAQERTGDGFAFIKKQLLFAIMGTGLLVGMSAFDYRKLYRWSYWILGAITALLALVLVPGMGSRAGGAQRWIGLGFLNVQPAEIAKFALILFVARQLERKADRIDRFVPGVLSSVMMVVPALGLLLLQPDFGSVVMISLVIFVLMFLAGVPLKYLLAPVCLGIVGAAAAILGSPYRHARLLAYLDPWKDPSGKGFQILQSLVGLHNGRIFGVGLGNGKEKLFYLPEAHNDFIFAVIGEELGFIGIACVVAAFVFFVYRGLRVAWVRLNEHEDRFGFLLAAGITLMIGLQGFINMSVVLGLLPTKGLSLPFISYGGSALLMDLTAIGILLSIAKGAKGAKDHSKA